ncbi:hypothetical protein [Ensifer sp. Root558]|uniref:hypothetical protein n=1 Tax=Ensifer sp. Root558 TaxID=1736558 RepID=UPI0012E97F3E|nr:hypothetical protein [Ensifer sp. Root558]
MSKTGTESAAETTKQIITLSTGMIGLTITFAEKFQAGTSLLKVSWVAFGIAIALSVWTLMSITGEENRATIANEVPDADRSSITIPALLMIVGFVVAMGLAIGAGFSRSAAVPASDAPISSLSLMCKVD